MQVDYEDIENGDDNIAELPLVEPPANEENHADFQVQGPTNLDLDSFLNLYEGNILLERLRFVADHSDQQQIEALTLATRAAKKTLNTDGYVEVYEKLQRLGGFELAGPMDEDWINETKKRITTTNDRLDTDIKNFRGNAIKESIKRGYEEMAEHKLQQGDIQGALKFFSKSRDYCIQPQHVRTMCLNVIKASVLLNNWTHVQSYVSKADSENKVNQQPEPLVKSRLNCASGLAELAARRYANAARKFLAVTFDSFQYSELVSSGNIAVYGAITALATLSRKELKESVLQSPNFKQFLELEPNMRETILAFIESRYCDALKYLKNMKNALLLDYFLSSHVEHLYREIRMRSLQQYLQPFLNAKISIMAESFNTSAEKLKDEIADLISTGRIPAKIDHLRGVILQEQADKRRIAIEKAVQAQKEFIWKSRSLLLRQGVIKAGLVVGEQSVKNPTKMEVGESFQWLLIR